MGIWYVRMQGGTLQTLAIIGQTSSFANTRHLLLLQIFQIFDIIAFGFHNILTIRDIYFLKKIGKYFWNYLLPNRLPSGHGIMLAYLRFDTWAMECAMSWAMFISNYT